MVRSVGVRPQSPPHLPGINKLLPGRDISSRSDTIAQIPFHISVPFLLLLLYSPDGAAHTTAFRMRAEIRK